MVLAHCRDAGGKLVAEKGWESGGDTGGSRLPVAACLANWSALLLGGKS